MQPLTQSLLNATRKASPLMQRDFFELELLQSSLNTPYGFANKTLARTKQILEEQLLKHEFQILDINSQLPQNNDKVIVIDPIDSLSNFTKSLPFFATMSGYITKIDDNWEATNLAMNFPALFSLYYIEKTHGAWSERYNPNDRQRSQRLRVSGCKSLSKAIIATNHSKKFNHLNHVLNFGSIYYMIMLYAAGKIDVLYFTNISPITSLCFELIVTAVGGVFIKNEDQFIATNSLLIEELKQSLM